MFWPEKGTTSIIFTASFGVTKVSGKRAKEDPFNYHKEETQNYFLTFYNESNYYVDVFSDQGQATYSRRQAEIMYTFVNISLCEKIWNRKRRLKAFTAIYVHVCSNIAPNLSLFCLNLHCISLMLP